MISGWNKNKCGRIRKFCGRNIKQCGSEILKNIFGRKNWKMCPEEEEIFFCLTRKKCTTKGKIFFPGLGYFLPKTGIRKYGRKKCPGIGKT